MRYVRHVMVGGCFFLAACSARAGVVVEPSVGVVEVSDDGQEDRVWVCHRGRWQVVGAPAAGGHSRHGDRVSSAPRPERGSC